MEKYYKALEVSRDATKEEIKSAYRKLAMKYHPDKNPGDAEAAKRMQEINEAYRYLSGNVREKQKGKTNQNYQQTEKQDFSKYSDFGWKRDGDGYKQSGMNGSEFKKMYDDLFGNRGKKRQYDQQNQNNKATPNDELIQCDIELDMKRGLDELLSGTDINYDITRKIICPDCGGTRTAKKCDRCSDTGIIPLRKSIKFSLNIRETPVHIATIDGAPIITLKFSGSGHQYYSQYIGIMSGDMYIRITVLTGGRDVAVSNGDIKEIITVPFGALFSKDGLRVSTADGKQYDARIHGAKWMGEIDARLHGMGYKKRGSDTAGDYVFDIRVKYPNIDNITGGGRDAALEILSML